MVLSKKLEPADNVAERRQNRKYRALPPQKTRVIRSMVEIESEAQTSITVLIFSQNFTQATTKLLMIWSIVFVKHKVGRWHVVDRAFFQLRAYELSSVSHEESGTKATVMTKLAVIVVGDTPSPRLVGFKPMPRSGIWDFIFVVAGRAEGRNGESMEMHAENWDEAWEGAIYLSW